MNAQIKELVKQAGLNIDGYGYPIWGCLHGEKAKKEFLEKFAELIVRKCAKVVDIWSDEVPCSEGYDKFTVGKLKEHFGIEE